MLDIHTYIHTYIQKICHCERLKGARQSKKHKFTRLGLLRHDVPRKDVISGNSSHTSLITSHSFAFTLAEVLITLGIIGVVVAMTIPALINKINDSELKTAYKKEFSVISSVIATENANSNVPYFNITALKSGLASQLKASKICDSSSTQGCWHKVNEFYTLANVPVSANYFTYPGFILQDGSLLTMSAYMALETNKDVLFSNSSYVVLYVDVNGFKKPNAIGKDIFAIKLLAHNAEAGGVNWCNGENCCDRTNKNASSLMGAGCGKNVLLGIDY